MTREVVYALCNTYGPLILLPLGIDGPRFMAAIAWNESSCGADAGQRYEESYDIGGANARNEQIGLLRLYGRRAAFSYGPWQTLLCNALGYTPDELTDDPEKCAQAFMGHFNRIMHEHSPATLSQLAQCWNAGHFTSKPSPGVQRYVNDAVRYYNDPAVIAGLTAARRPAVATSIHQVGQIAVQA